MCDETQKMLDYLNGIKIKSNIIAYRIKALQDYIDEVERILKEK